MSSVAEAAAAAVSAQRRRAGPARSGRDGGDGGRTICCRPLGHATVLMMQALAATGM
jgi:hypothetical protein